MSEQGLCLRAGREGTRVVCCWLLLFQVGFPPQFALAHPTHPGKWTGASEWNRIAVNLVLLPGGPSGHHSRVLLWNDDLDTLDQVGALRGWDPPDDATVNAGAFPETSFPAMTLEDFPVNPFCAGATMLGDGRLLVTGGDDLFEIGIRSALLLSPDADANGEWTRAPDMVARRWYPSTALLPSGSTVTASGSSFMHFVNVGGINPAAAPDATQRLLQRYEVSPDGLWEPSVVPTDATNTPMDPVSDAGADAFGTSSMLLFGGKNALGNRVNAAIQVTRDRNSYAPDYWFKWKSLVKAAGSDDPPSTRFGSAVVTITGTNDVLVIGGSTLLGSDNRIWRAHLNDAGDLTWKQLTLAGPAAGTFPSVHGMCAFCDVDSAKISRVYTFGGSSTPDNAPATASVNVYVLEPAPGSTFANTTSITITQATVTNTAPGDEPGARSYASLTYDARGRGGMPGVPGLARHRAVLFGGHKVGGGYSDALHMLWVRGPYDPYNVTWVSIPITGTQPTGRAHHGAAYDSHSQWLVVSGGETATAAASAEVWTFDMDCAPSQHCDVDGRHTWVPRASMPNALRGQSTALLGPEPAFPRLPEKFDPLTNTWSTIPAPHFQEWFPQGFAAPRMYGDPPGETRERVFYAGPETQAVLLRLYGTPGWETLPDNPAGKFKAGAAVMYRPGKVMKCGTRDTGPLITDGRTAVIDLKSPSPVWDSAAAGDQMIGRRNHNVVLLPTGEAIVVGGGKVGDNENTVASNMVHMPQIWNPDTLVAGHWYGQEKNAQGDPLMLFDSSSVHRFYHSSAVLLPDGRILCAGGSSQPAHQSKADLYSPYYLFNANGTPATRPVIANAPASVAYGEPFPVCMSAGGSTPTRFALVRPGAATHGFDQNQRYVPLTLLPGSPFGSPAHYLVSAPADSFDAPPGDYMLFALSSTGTPSIANWVRLRSVHARDGHPTWVTNLAKVCSLGDQVELQWTPPIADSGSICPAPAAKYELHYKTGTMSTWQEFGAGVAAPNLPLPADPTSGFPQGVLVSGLTPNTTYTFRLISKNHRSDDGEWSAMSNALTFVTHVEECGGAGGGGGGGGHEGASARRTAGGTWLRRTGGGTGGDPAFLENTLLPNVVPGVVTNDLVRLPYGPLWTASGARVQLSRTGVLGTRFSRVRLRGVSLAAGEEAFPCGDSVLVGSLTPPARVWHADGRELTAQLAADSAFDCHEADTLYVEFANALPGRIALETSGAHLVIAPDRTGFDVQCETAEGWRTVAHHDPRERRADALHELPGMGRVRLISLGVHRLHGVARFEPGIPATGTVFEPLAITHSTLGDVSATLASGGALLAHGESMLADFGVTQAQAGSLDWFLEVTGAHEAVAASGTSSGRGAPGETAPVRFTLEQNQPNPFGSDTRIGFSLPVRTNVRLEVFDLLGRRVATLANGTYEAGRHSVTWDRRTAAGTRAAAGVYTCRISTGERHEQRRMIVFP